jgi:hypothetical protein
MKKPSPVTPIDKGSLLTKMLMVTINTTGTDTNEAQKWADELTKVCADMEVKDVNISENKISFELLFTAHPN